MGGWGDLGKLKGRWGKGIGLIGFIISRLPVYMLRRNRPGLDPNGEGESFEGLNKCIEN